MTGKTNGVDTWTYTWNDENRLVRVQGPGSVDVAYVYDLNGRLMSRDDGSNVTTLVWDGFDCVRETTGMSTTTYCTPEGQLLSFIRNGSRYEAHTDHVMSVRMVTDDSGDIVWRKEFDAFGNELPGAIDSLPGGLAYGFVGAAGCRADSSISLIYMRQRWYVPSLRRFISRDPLGLRAGGNLYGYCENNPSLLIDPTGEQPPLRARREWCASLLRRIQNLRDEIDSRIDKLNRNPQDQMYKCPGAKLDSTIWGHIYKLAETHARLVKALLEYYTHCRTFPPVPPPVFQPYPEVKPRFIFVDLTVPPHPVVIPPPVLPPPPNPWILVDLQPNPLPNLHTLPAGGGKEATSAVTAAMLLYMASQLPRVIPARNLAP